MKDAAKIKIGGKEAIIWTVANSRTQKKIALERNWWKICKFWDRDAGNVSFFVFLNCGIKPRFLRNLALKTETDFCKFVWF